MKRKVQKKNPVFLLSAAFLAAASCFPLSACSNQAKEPVVAERTTEENTESMQTSEHGPEHANVRETETTLAETAGNIESGSPGLDSSRTSNAASGRQTLSSMVDAPKHYQAEVKGEHTTLTADAEVKLPESGIISVYNAETVPYSDEDYEHFKLLMESAAGIRWSADTNENGHISTLSEDGNYALSFVDGTMEGTTPILWMHHRYLSAGSSANFDSSDISDFSLSDEEKRQKEKQITGQAQELLDKLNAGTFLLKSSQWRRLRTDDPTVSQEASESQYGLKLNYVRAHQGIPITDSRPALLGSSASSSQYVELLYSSDGTLLTVKDIDRQKISEDGDNGRFLLPFASVAQIFEQYCKTFYNDNQHFALIPAAAETNPVLIPYTDENHAAIKVSGVSLEYRFQHNPESDGYEKGKLIPVWNFYGSLELWGQSWNGEGLLVSINAEDGTIYGKLN